MANIILHPWRLASEPMPLELYGMPLLIEDFLGNYVVGHYAGLWWADKTKIEKAYQWILNNMHKYIKVKGFEIFVNNEDMANDFKQAMEE